MEKQITPVPTSVEQDIFFKVDGLHCASCVQKISRTLDESKLCEAFWIDVATKTVRVRKGHIGLSAATFTKEIKGKLKKIGYPAQFIEDPTQIKKYAWVAQLCYSSFGLLISLCVMSRVSVPFDRRDLMILLGVVFLFFASFKNFALNAWAALKTKSFGVDTLVTVGAGAAFILSMALIIAQVPGHLYWVEAFAILLLVSLGHYLENFVFARADKTLRSLMVLAPPKALRILVGSHKTEEVLVAELAIGDRIQLRPGDRVAVDGKIIDGRSDFDESLLTGEAMPVAKGPNDEIFAGTINLTGNLQYEVRKLGRDTLLSQIIETVLHMRQTRADIQQLADKISNVFVPVVIGLAVLCFALWILMPHAMHIAADWTAYALYTHDEHLDIFWKAFSASLGVLVIACPCAMGLATPAALMAVSGAAAKKGILIRDGHAIESAEKITHVFFDKTGTLSSALPKKISEWKSPDFQNDLLAAVASQSHHPLSRALANESKNSKRILQFKIQIEEFPGEGLKASVEEKTSRTTVVMGSSLLLQRLEISIPASAQEFTLQQLEEGRSLVYWAQEGALSAIFSFEDELREGVDRLLEKFSAQAKVFILSGDHKKVLASLAKKLKLPPDQVMGGLTPLDKVKVIQSYQNGKQKVAFIGDGLNDAPVLQAADLGIAVGSASDLAKQSADIVLLTKELDSLFEAFLLAKKGMKTIRQNLIWAFGYNIVAIPLAFLGLISPVLCTFSMAFSDIVIIANSVRVFASKKN